MALKSLRDVNQRIVAVVSISALAVFIVFAFLVGQLKLLEGGYEMSGVFTDTAGMKEGDDVRVAGVKVGSVKTVRADFATGHVIITWKVNSGIDLGESTRAEVQTATLLGGRYLKLTGPVAKPYMADLPASRRRIPVERTSTPFTITDALQSSTQLTRTLDKASINKLLDESSKIDIPTKEKLGAMLRNFQELAAMLNEQYPQISALIANSRKVTSTLASKDQELTKIIDASQVLLDSLVKRRNELAATIGQGSRTVRALSSVISQHQAEIDRLLSNLHLLTSRIAPNMEALNADFALMGPTFRQVANIRGNGHYIEGLLTGLGPLQPAGPQSTRRTP